MKKRLFSESLICDWKVIFVIFQKNQFFSVFFLSNLHFYQKKLFITFFLEIFESPKFVSPFGPKLFPNFSFFVKKVVSIVKTHFFLSFENKKIQFTTRLRGGGIFPLFELTTLELLVVRLKIHFFSNPYSTLRVKPKNCEIFFWRPTMHRKVVWDLQKGQT